MSIADPFFYIQDSLNNNASISDHSRHARAILMSGVREERDADFGSCFHLSSDAYFEVSCPVPASFTLALWVRCLLPDEGGGQTRSLVQLGSHNARLCTNELKPSFADAALATQKLGRDVWQHLALSFDAGTKMCIVYLDGARVASGSATLDTSGDILRIGLGTGAGELGFEGKIAHFVLYEHALSDEDIQELMWATEKTLTPILLLRDTARLAQGIVKDDSGHGLECTAQDVTLFEDGERGPCFQLDKGYIACDAQMCPSAFTLSAWVKQHSSAHGSFYPLIEFGENAPGLQIKDSKLSLAGGASSTANFPAGVWKHVAVTYNPITLVSNLYLDGVHVGTATGPIDTSGAGLLVGTGWREEDPLFEGLMTHVAIYDAPLSPREIEDLRAFSAAWPQLYLPLEVKDATGRTPDTSGRGAAALCSGSVAVSDSRFGTAFSFDGVDDFIDISSLACPASFTFAAYIRPDAIACAREVPILEFGTGQPYFWLSYGRLKVHAGPIADANRALTPDTWYHVAATYDGSTRAMSLYINGELVTSGEFTGSAGGIGLGIGHRYSANWFRGRMRHVMIYDQAFSKDLIRQIIAYTSPPSSKTPRPLTRPGVGLFSMDLLNDDEQPVLYLDQIQQLSLSVENTWGGDIQLVAATSPVGPEVFHFQMQFRQGTLNPAFRDELIAGTGDTVNGLSKLGWALHCQDLDTGGDLISLLWTGSSSGTPPAGLIKSKARVVLPLLGVQAKLGAGTRSTRVLMRYDRMKLPDGSDVPRGQRIELLNLMVRPRTVPGTIAGVVASLLNEQITVDSKLPVEIKLQASKTLLNDGGPNRLAFTIKNTRRIEENAARLELGNSGAADTAPKLYVQLPKLFDDADGSTSDNINGVSVSLTSSSMGPQHIWTCSREGSRWCIQPPADEMFFEPNEVLTLTLDNLKTSERHGTIYLTLRYEDIANFGEGEFHIPVHIGPLSYSRIGDRDTVIIRHGNQASIDPANEALFVETSEGMAARFVGGGGVEIKNPDTNARALSISMRPESVGPAIFVEKSGGSSHGVHVDATSSDAAVFVEQDGKGHGIRVYKTDSKDPSEAGSQALHVVHKGKVAAVRIDKTGAQYGLHVDATSSDAAVRVEQHDIGAGLSVNKEGDGLAAEFIGGDGVSISSSGTSKAPALYVDQNGTGPVAKFTGGSGIEAGKVSATTVSATTVSAATVSATTVSATSLTSGTITSTGAMQAQSTLQVDGNLTANGAMQAQSTLQVSGNLKANGGLSVASGASVSGVSVVEFQTLSFGADCITGYFWSGSATASFSRPVQNAQVFLQSFDIWFSDKSGVPGESSKGDDTHDRPFHRMKIDPWISSKSGYAVDVSIKVGLRDASEAVDDKYGFRVTVVVIALLQCAP